MNFKNAYTYSKPYDQEPILTPEEVFIHRVLQRHLSLWMHEEIEDDLFLKFYHASFRSNGSGPAPWGALMGVPHPFVQIYEEMGLNKQDANAKGRKVCSFFFKDCKF